MKPHDVSLYEIAIQLRACWRTLVGDSDYSPAEVLLQCERQSIKDPMLGAEADDVIQYMRGMDESAKNPPTECRLREIAAELHARAWKRCGTSLYRPETIGIEASRYSCMMLTPEQADIVGDMIEEIVIAADETAIHVGIITYVNEAQISRVTAYLDSDYQAAVKAIGRWKLDRGKLYRAFELAGIGVGVSVLHCRRCGIDSRTAPRRKYCGDTNVAHQWEAIGVTVRPSPPTPVDARASSTQAKS